MVLIPSTVVRIGRAILLPRDPLLAFEGRRARRASKPKQPALSSTQRQGYQMKIARCILLGVTLLAVLVAAGKFSGKAVPARAARAGVNALASQSALPGDGTEPLPPGATIETLLTNMNQPVAMAFDPQGR